MYTSRDRKNWKGPQGNNNGFPLKKGDAFGTSGFWAPQVFQHNGRFYMAYVANERKFSFSQERFFDGQSGFIRLIRLVSQELAE